MYTPNLERNKHIYKLWERGLTVDRISSLTGVPRSTVGYYVRKFNRLAVEGKPVVFPGARKASRESFSRVLDEMTRYARVESQTIAFKILEQGKAEKLYYMLMDLKLLRELGLLVTSEDYEKALKSVGLI